MVRTKECAANDRREICSKYTSICMGTMFMSRALGDAPSSKFVIVDIGADKNFSASKIIENNGRLVLSLPGSFEADVYGYSLGKISPLNVIIALQRGLKRVGATMTRKQLDHLLVCNKKGARRLKLG